MAWTSLSWRLGTAAFNAASTVGDAVLTLIRGERSAFCLVVVLSSRIGRYCCWAPGSFRGLGIETVWVLRPLVVWTLTVPVIRSQMLLMFWLPPPRRPLPPALPPRERSPLICDMTELRLADDMPTDGLVAAAALVVRSSASLSPPVREVVPRVLFVMA